MITVARKAAHEEGGKHKANAEVIRLLAQGYTNIDKMMANKLRRSGIPVLELPTGFHGGFKNRVSMRYLENWVDPVVGNLIQKWSIGFRMHGNWWYHQEYEVMLAVLRAYVKGGYVV